MKNVKVLLLSANPEEKNLRLDAEQRDLRERVELSEWQRQKADQGKTVAPIEFIQASAARMRDLPRMLKLHAPQVLHFSGHGAASGEILFETQEGRRAPLPPQALANLLSPFRSLLRLVFLNACYSQRQACSVVQSVECCIGMSQAIEDTVALTFAQAFYDLIALGSSVGEAFQLACQELTTLPGGRDLHTVPQLLSRKDIDVNQLFLAPMSTDRRSLASSRDAAFDSSLGEPLHVPEDASPALRQLASLRPGQLNASRLRRGINDMLPIDAELNAFMQARYPRSARQLTDNMQRTTKLNILLTYESDLLRLRQNLLEFCLDQTP